MHDWQLVRLDDVADIRISNVDKKSFASERPVRLCNYMDVYGNDYIDCRIAFMEATASQAEIERFKVQSGDVLITKDSETPDDIGIPAVVMEDVQGLVAGYHLALIRPRRDRVDPVYLAKQLSAEQAVRHYSRRAAGSTRYGLSTSTIASTPILVPSIPVQRRIAEILSTLDITIEKAASLIEKLTSMRVGLTDDLFTRGLAGNGTMRLERQLAPRLYTQSTLGSLPNDWQIRSIDTVAHSLVDGPFGSNLKSEHYVDEPGVRVVRLQNVGSGTYSDSDKAFVSQRHAAYLSRHEVLPGDVLVAGLGDEARPVGRACCYPAELPPAINKADCFRLRCEASQALNPYVMLFLNTPRARHQVLRYEQGVTRLRINLGNLRRIQIPLPSLQEQQMVIDRVAAATADIDAAIAQHSKALATKQGLGADLLSGRVTVAGC
jgi:type I restriction enzyme S subunit